MKYANSFTISSLNGRSSVVEIESSITNGLPGMQIIGLVDTSVQEAKERFKSALINSGFKWPGGKVVLSLSPASSPKLGAKFDLGMAVSVFAAITKEVNREKLKKSIFIGELSLNGKIRPANSILNEIINAQKLGFENIIIPAANLPMLSYLPHINVFGSNHLSKVLGWLLDLNSLEEISSSQLEFNENLLDFSEILGQNDAKRALEIAAAGGHNLLMLGSPGVGKTMLAKRFSTILPELSLEESLEIAAINNLTMKELLQIRLTTPPFVAPHYKSSMASIIGGGTGIASPGAITKANKGVLFLDEFTEMGIKTLEALRTPLEDGVIKIARKDGIVEFPADFQLILAANPCPCAPLKDIDCICSPSIKNRYKQKLSGPLVDRIDMKIVLHAPSLFEINEQKSESSKKIRQRVINARALAKKRWGINQKYLNAKISNKTLNKVELPKKLTLPFYRKVENGELSLRGINRIIRLAWTISDLKCKEFPSENELQEAERLQKNI